MRFLCRWLAPASIAMIVWALPYSTLAEDWPMWRYDVGHTGSSPEQLSENLRLQWVLELPTPVPCWPYPSQYKVQFDHTYEPIVMDGLLFVPSMIRDCMTAYDAETGEERWRFYTDGPVRFAPVGSKGKIYFVSDDGCLYCLDAVHGSLEWKCPGGPSNYKVLGNERLISMWPARGGPVIADGIVYFAASIWPFMGTFIHALDAETGTVKWTNSGSGPDFMLQPHTSPAFAGVSPQGILGLTEDKLFIPGGRNRPAAYNRATGEFLYQHADTKLGGCEVYLSKEWFFNDGQIYQISDGTQVGSSVASILTEELMIGMDESGILHAWSWEPVWKEFTDRRGTPQKRMEFVQQWKAKTPFKKLMIRAGNHLYCGSPGLIAAIRIPESRGSMNASIAWQAEMEGNPWSAVVADGKLFVITEEGRIYCFGERETEEKVHSLPKPTGSSGKEKSAAAQILETTEGYCLVLGAGTGDRIEDLARQSALHMVVLEPNPRKVESLRRRFDDAGLYGQRIALIPGSILTVPMSPYFANLVVVEDTKAAGIDKEHFFERVFHVLRPYGGVAWLPKEEGLEDRLRKSAESLPNAEVTVEDSHLLLKRNGALPGSDSWTHQYGDMSNDVCSKDQLVKPPLAPLWFGGPAHTDVLPRHAHGPPQKIMNGRLFIEGIQVMSARDVYTGRVLWKKEIPNLNTFDMYYDKTYKEDPFDRTYNQVHIPGANAYGSNFTLAPDRLYLTVENVCMVLDPATGATLNEWTIPLETDLLDVGTPNWGYIGVYEDLLIAGAAPVHITVEGGKEIVKVNHRFGVGSRYLVAMDRITGERIWQRKAEYNFRHNSIAAGNGKLFCIDNLSTQRMDVLKRRGLEVQTSPKILALDIRTGEELWSREEDVFGTWLGYSTEYDVLLEAGSQAGDRAKDEIGEGMAAFKGATGDLLWKNSEKYFGPCMIRHDRLITQTGGSTQESVFAKAFSLLTGEPVMTTHPLTGEKIPWSWVRFKGCNTAICSEHLLTFRSASAAYMDMTQNSGTVNIGGFRSGCTSNLIAADGVLNAPDYTRTCTCSYQVQTSLALVHTPFEIPENPWVEQWSFNAYPPPEQPAPVKRVGINFGAPGNRMDDNGTLWLEFPSVGGPSPDLPIYVDSGDPKVFRQHPSYLVKETEEQAHWNWVAASGLEGDMRLVIRPFVQPKKPDQDEIVRAYLNNFSTRDLHKKPDQILGEHSEPQSYSVTLVFAEKEQERVDERVFDVYLQGEKVLAGFNIAKEAQGPKRVVSKTFKGIPIKDDLSLELKAAKKDRTKPPILCGMEITCETE
ncbi:MAG TPA: PQQ-binding-like beta-propeller repeat protein [bacterium]|mgnify:FL=1|nr:PQQ-binding-like beta-propeller repeat protein [bacterium]HQP98595.1 PQQ-binding-like beta-propeller repeat protein [bacterium]